MFFNCCAWISLKKNTQQHSFMRSPAPVQNKASFVINTVAPDKCTILNNDFNHFSNCWDNAPMKQELLMTRHTDVGNICCVFG